jgi:hypothetical protein
VLWVLGQRLDFLATGETTSGHYSLFHVFIPAGPPGPLPDTHRDADEIFFAAKRGGGRRHFIAPASALRTPWWG